MYISRGIRLFFLKYCILLSEDLLIFTNNVDPDKIQHYATFHLVLAVLFAKELV